MNRKIKHIVIWLCGTLVLCGGFFTLKNRIYNGTNYIRDGHVIHYYIPLEYTAGAYSFNNIERSDKTGIELQFVTYESLNGKYDGTVGELYLINPDGSINPYIAIECDKRETAQRIGAKYDKDGRLEFIAYMSDNGSFLPVWYSLTAENAEEDTVDYIAEGYAALIAAEVKKISAESAAARVFFEYSLNDKEFEVYAQVGTADELAEIREKYSGIADSAGDYSQNNRIRCESADSYLKALLSSVGGREREDVFMMVMERAGILLGNELDDMISVSDEFRYYSRRIE